MKKRMASIQVGKSDVVKNTDKSRKKRNISSNPLIRADNYIKDKYPKTQYNIISETIDFGVKNITTDDVITELKMAGVKITRSDFETFLRSNRIAKIDVFEEYFESLKGKWNPKKKDYIKQLSKHINTEDNKLWRSMFKKHLVRSVRQAYGDTKFANRFVIVLQSKEESIGKSTFLRFLNPFDDLYYKEHIDQNDMDLVITKVFIFNFEELESLNSIGFNKLKAVISSVLSTFRRLYTQTYTSKPRRCSFWGSTNDEGFLGGGQNTRWIIINVKSVDFAYSNLKIKKIWAQAVYLLNSGFNYELTKEELEAIKRNSKEYRFQSREELLILEYFEKSKRYLNTATDIARHINESSTEIKVGSRRIGKALKDMGYNQRMQDNKRLYNIKVIANDEEINNDDLPF